MKKKSLAISPYQPMTLKKHWIEESLQATADLHDYKIKYHPRLPKAPEIVAENTANKISYMKLQSSMQQHDLGVSSRQLQEKLHCCHENSAAHLLAIDFPVHCEGVALMALWCLD